jgi:CheY-like chemotaxis protein
MTACHRYAALILVIDDNATNRRNLCHQIRASKMQARDAASSPEALEKLRKALQKVDP